MFGDNLEPDAITELLQCDPSSAHRLGETIGRKGKRIAKTGLWSLRASTQNPGNLDIQVEEILGKMTGDLGTWKRVSKEYRVDLFVGVFLKHGNEGLSISTCTLLKLGERGIEIDLDIYGGDGEDEND